MEASKNVVNSGCFQKSLQWRVANFCGNEEGMQGALSKNAFLVALLGSQYLFKILHTCLTFFSK